MPRAVVEFEVRQHVGGEWVLDRRIEITADSAGVARLPLHLDVPARWSVRARALATSAAAASVWSDTFRYDVQGSAAASLERRWSAGFSGGSATFSALSDGTSLLTLHATGLPRAGAVAASIRRGACDAGGRPVVAFRSVRTGASGALDVTLTLSAGQRRAAERATASGDVVSFVLRAGAVTRCAPLVPRPIGVARIGTGEEASGVAADLEAIWVTNIFDDTLSRIDPASNVVTASIPVPGYPAGVASDGRSVWVTHLSTGMLSRVDIATREVAQTIPIGALPGNLVFAARAVWVVVGGEDAIAKVDPQTGEVLGMIDVAPDPFGIAAAGGSLWVTSPGAGVVTRIDARSGEVLAEIDVPDVVDVAASDQAVWVSVDPARSSAGAVVRIDPATNEVAARVAVGYEPAGLAIAGDSVFVAMAGEPTLVQVRADRVRARVAVGMKSLAIARGFGSLWLLHPYGAGIAGSGLFDGGVTRLNL
jgi:YVTN family beta-propeller protein